MRAQICFFVSIVFSFVAWGAVTGSLILPELRRRGRNEALRPLLMFHSFRFVGLAFPKPVNWALPTFSQYRAALSDHARTHVLASTTKRKRSRRAGRAAARLK